MAILRSGSGGQFDPLLVDVFIELIESGKLELRFGEPEQLSEPEQTEEPVTV